MKTTTWILLTLILALCSTSGTACHAQADEVNPFNIPDELESCLRGEPQVKPNGAINPFYISGDFDGDRFTDFVVQVKTVKSGAQGVLFCFANGRRTLWGAGFRNGYLPVEGYWPFNSWLLIRKGSKHLASYPSIKHDVIALIIADEGGGLLYWDGTQLRWKTEE